MWYLFTEHGVEAQLYRSIGDAADAAINLSKLMGYRQCKFYAGQISVHRSDEGRVFTTCGNESVILTPEHGYR